MGQKKELPKVNFPHLIQILFRVGPCFFNGVDKSPLTFSEIKSYSDTVKELNSWEIDTIKELSDHYVLWCAKAKNKDQKPPWNTLTKIDRKNVSEQLQSKLSSSFNVIKVKNIRNKN